MKPTTKQYTRAGVIGRFKPLHNGGAVMLDAVCEASAEVVIGIGSSNKYNARNPFTADETEAMLRAYLEPRHSNFTIIRIPDFGHIPEYADGKKWTEYVLSAYGKLDVFFSGNEYARNLLEQHYKVMHPVEIIPKERQAMVSATKVRTEMAMHSHWEKLVPKEIVDYITSHGLDKRFREEFGLETLASLSDHSSFGSESLDDEKHNVRDR